MPADNVLLENSGDATGPSRKFTGIVGLYLDGTFGGGTVHLQLAKDNNGVCSEVWADIRTATAPVRHLVYFPGRYWLRATVTGSTGASITVEAA